MLVLERKENEVYYNNIKLKINPQASKGPNNEVVYIKDCPEANGQTWISLTRLKQGINEIECKAKTVSSKYELTEEEKSRIAELEQEIAQIKENARKRYVEKPNLKLDPSKLTQEEKLAEIAKLQKYIESLKA